MGFFRRFPAVVADDDDDRSDGGCVGRPCRTRLGRRRREGGISSVSLRHLPPPLLSLLLLVASPMPTVVRAKLTVIDPPLTGLGVVNFETLPASFGRRFLRGESYRAVLRLPPNFDDDPYLCGTSQRYRRELVREPELELGRDLSDGGEGGTAMASGGLLGGLLLRGLGSRSMTNDPDSFAQLDDTEDFLRPRPVHEDRPNVSSTAASSSSLAAFEEVAEPSNNGTNVTATNSSDYSSGREEKGAQQQGQTQAPKGAPTKKVVEVPVALLVKRGMCSFGAKAKTALTIDLNGKGEEDDTDGDGDGDGGTAKDDDEEEPPPSNLTATGTSPKETATDPIGDTYGSDDIEVDPNDVADENDVDTFDEEEEEEEVIDFEYRLVVRYMIVYNNNPTEDLVVMASPWGPPGGGDGGGDGGVRLDLGMLFASHESGLRLLAALADVEKEKDAAAVAAGEEEDAATEDEDEDGDLFVKTNATKAAAGTATTNTATTTSTPAPAQNPLGGLLITMDSTIPERFSQYGFGWWGGSRSPHADADTRNGRFRSTQVMVVLRYVLLSFLVLLPCLRGLCLYVAVRRRNEDIARRRLRGENVRDDEELGGGGGRFELVFVRTGSPRRGGREGEDDDDNRLTREEVLALPEIVHGSGRKLVVQEKKSPGGGGADVEGAVGLGLGGRSAEEDGEGGGGRRSIMTDTTVDDDTARGDVDVDAAEAADAVGGEGCRGDGVARRTSGNSSSILDEGDEDDMGLYLIFGSGSGSAEESCGEGDAAGAGAGASPLMESATAAADAGVAVPALAAPPVSPAVESAPSDELRQEAEPPPPPLMADDPDHHDHDLEFGNVTAEEEGVGRQYYEHASCSVCLDDYEDGETLRVLPCGHSFHDECILPWLTERQGCCPLCKTPVVVERHRRPPPRPDEEEVEEEEAEDAGRASRAPTSLLSSFQSSPTTPPSSSSPPSPPLMDMYTPRHHPTPTPAAENAALWFFSPPPFNRPASAPPPSGGGGASASGGGNGSGSPRRRPRHGRRLPRNPFPFTLAGRRYGAASAASGRGGTATTDNARSSSLGSSSGEGDGEGNGEAPPAASPPTLSGGPGGLTTRTGGPSGPTATGREEDRISPPQEASSSWVPMGRGGGEGDGAPQAIPALMWPPPPVDVAAMTTSL